MGVQPRHGQARGGNALGAKGGVEQAQALHDRRAAHLFQGDSQGQMPGEEHHAQFPCNGHHLALLGPGPAAEEFGLALHLFPRHMQGLLAHRRGDEGRDLSRLSHIRPTTQGR